MVRAGPMRHSITIQTRSTAQDGSGEPQDVWTTFATRRASIERTTGKEAVASAAEQGRVPTVFRIRYLAGVVPKMRILHGSAYLNLLSAVDPTGLKEELLLTCEEWVGATA